MSDLGNKEIMAANIKRFMRENKINQTDICNTLGFAMTTFSDWVNAKTYPRIDKIELMANYFGISKSDLVEKCSPHTTMSEAAQRVGEAYDKADTGTQASVRKLLDVPSDEDILITFDVAARDGKGGSVTITKKQADKAARTRQRLLDEGADQSDL